MHLRHGHGLHDAFGFVGVVAQKVYCLTHFADGIAPGLVGQANRQAAEALMVRMRQPLEFDTSCA